jgi:glycine/D-amino acid oxidase-like deaminating enzyme
MVDVIIVGSGISGCCMAWKCVLEGKSVIMISDDKRSSSSVAAGVYNPIVLKRFSPVWNGAEQLDAAIPFYNKIEKELGIKLLHEITILRRLHDAGEVKTWMRKSERSDLSRFMNTVIYNQRIPGVHAPHDFGVVNETGWLDTQLFMQSTISYLREREGFVDESFDYDRLLIKQKSVLYGTLESRNIIFAEGYGLINNPYFNYLPLQGNKGEVLTIKVPGLELNHIIKSSVFLMPYKEDLFWVGATYDRDDKTYEVTDTALNFLTSRLEVFLKLPYEIVDHKTGIRPTTDDRRPFAGTHPRYSSLKILNGMGSRAVLVAPWVASQLFDCIFNKSILNPEININRFHN